MASGLPNFQPVGRWPYGPAGPVTGDPDRGLVFAGAGGAVVVFDTLLNKKSDFTFARVIGHLFYDTNRLYAADAEGLVVIDAANAEALTQIGTFEIPIDEMSLSGNYAYIITDGVLTILNVSDAENIQTTGSLTILECEDRELKVHATSFVSGNHLFVIDCDTLLILDVSDPADPVLISSYLLSEYSNPYWDLFVLNQYAYIISGDELWIFDISDPTSPERITRSEIPNFYSLSSIFVTGDSAYVGLTWGGIVVVDISDPYHPSETGFYDSDVATKMYKMGDTLFASEWGYGDLIGIDTAHDIYSFTSFNVENISFSGSYAAIFNGSSCELQVLDISNPSAPLHLGKTEDLPYSSSGMSFSGNKAVVLSTAAGASGNGTAVFDIFDISDPNTLVQAGSYENESLLWLDAKGMLLEGNLLFLASEEHGLWIIDISDPASPEEIGRLDQPGTDIQVVAGHAFIKNGQSIQIIDVSDPTQPSLAGTVQVSDSAHGFDVSANRLCVYAKNTFWLFDLSDPAHPSLVKTVSTDFPISKVDITGNYACSRIANSYGGVVVYDISDPTTPNEYGFANIPVGYGEYSSFDVHDGSVYIGDAHGLRIIDISTVASHPRIEPFDAPDRLTDIDVSGNYAYVVDGISRMEGPGPQALRIVDINDLGAPEAVGLVDDSESSDCAINSLHVTGDYVFGRSCEGLAVIDISEPTQAFEASFLETGYSYDTCYEFQESGHDLYIVNNNSVDIFDISNPITPVLSDTMADVTHLNINAARALAVNMSGFSILDMSAPDRPILGSFQVSDEIVATAYPDNLAVVITRRWTEFPESVHHLRIIDLSDVTQPTEMGSVEISNFNPPYDLGNKLVLKVTGKYALIADRENGLRVIDISTPAAPFEALIYDTPGEVYDIALSGDYIHVADGRGGFLTLKVEDEISTVGCDKNFETKSGTDCSGTLACGEPLDQPNVYTIVSTPQNGTVQISDPSNGAFVYTPNADFTGDDTFTFVVTNGTIETDPATATIAVSASSGNGGGGGGCFISSLWD